ncbi:MAG: polyketide synthase, partial [Bacteroidetes bacterium]|nr:polyketide synthase [Bacteroidota bacterium]
GALTRDEMSVYDKNGKGFIPGEGCGMVIMKRLEDAERDNNQIYAVLEGWGISSDGKGGITAPSAIGQSRALLRAYEKGDFDPEKLNFIEGHGTGTTVGDKTELEGITIALNKKKTIPQRNCGVTSFKSIVGHTKAAAGVGAFIKTVMALNRRVIPPTAGLKELNPIFEDKARTIYPILQGQVLDPGTLMYAGVSAMGFGGINSHVVLRSGEPPIKKLQPVLNEKKLLVTNQICELFLFAAESKVALAGRIRESLEMVKGISYAELQDYAFQNNTNFNLKLPYRAAVVSGEPFDLERKLNELLEGLKIWETTIWQKKETPLFWGGKRMH